MPIARDQFFIAARRTLFTGRLTVPQVEGLTLLLARWERDHAASDPRWLAYILATVHHETDRTMQPIAEYGRGQGKKYGLRYYGRGYCQLTWDFNYRWFGERLRLDLLGQPDLALQPEIAADILFIGMVEGRYTGRALRHYIAGPRCDFVQARRIVNGMDKAALIADYARRYHDAIRPEAAAAA